MPKLLIIILAVLILAAGGGVTVMQQMELGPFAKAIELIPEEKAAEAAAAQKDYQLIRAIDVLRGIAIYRQSTAEQK